MIRGPCFTCHHVITPHNAVPCKQGAAGNCRLAITDSICNVTLTILYVLPLLPETTLWLITAAAAAALYRPGMLRMVGSAGCVSSNPLIHLHVVH